jgi:predicted metal-dependent peptidase
MAPFISTILYGLRARIDPTIPTLCTNGLVLRINPEFFLNLPDKVRIAALAHEAWHVALLHCLPMRVLSRDFKRWNIAADYVINLMLENSGYEIGKNWYCDKRFENLTTEQVYDLLPAQPQMGRPGSGKDGDDGLGEDFETYSGNGDNPDEQDGDGNAISGDALEQKIKRTLTSAAAAQRMSDPSSIGSLPGEFQRIFDKLLNPTVPWFLLLRDYMYDFQKSDYSYRRFNKRYMPDFFLPTLYSEAMGRLSVGIDVSGSVTTEIFQKFVSEVYHSREILNPTTTDIISWDWGIQDIVTLNQGDEIKGVEFKGGGGTDVSDLIEWAQENRPEVLVILTDGYFRMPDASDNPGCPIIWCIYDNDNFNPPFGKTVYIEAPGDN